MIYIINFFKFLCSIFLEELYYLIMIHLLINLEFFLKKYNLNLFLVNFKYFFTILYNFKYKIINNINFSIFRYYKFNMNIINI